MRGRVEGGVGPKETGKEDGLSSVRKIGNIPMD